MNALVNVGVDHSHKKCLVLRVELKRNLLKAIDDKTETILFGRVCHKLVDFFNEHLSCWYFEVSIEIVSQSFSIVGDHLNLELRHRSLHYFVNHSIHYLVRVGLQQILQQMKILCVLSIGFIGGIHFLNGRVKQIFEEAFLVHLIDIECK